jgi:cell wall-associated NlpC family hydrolase
MVLVVAVLFSGTGASAQTVESLRARADRIANELEQLERRSSELDEQYLVLGEELEQLEAERAEKQAAVDEARKLVDRTRSEATGYLVEAYIGAGSSNAAALRTTDVNSAVNQRALLEIVRGDRDLLADDMDVSRQDLEARVAELEAAEEAMDARRAEQQQVVEEIEQSVAEHERLLDGANSELQAAIDAERRRREEQAAQRAAAAAAAQAERAEQAERQARTTTTTQTQRSSRGERSTTTAPPRSAPHAPAPPADVPLPVSGPNGRAAGAIAAARSVLGTPYRWAGSSPSTGFDCSGLMSWAWSQVGVSLPRTSRGMFAGTQRISASQLQPGDLVFYGSPVHHVGMYVGGGQMIHSPRTGDVVKIAPIHRGFGNPSGYGRI